MFMAGPFEPRPCPGGYLMSRIVEVVLLVSPSPPRCRRRLTRRGWSARRIFRSAMAQTIANAALRHNAKAWASRCRWWWSTATACRSSCCAATAPACTRRRAPTARPIPRAPSASRRPPSPSACWTEPARVGSLQYTRVLALGGGLPIKVGNEVIGAVGVSGSPGKDDVCSQAGIDKVADQLK